MLPNRQEGTETGKESIWINQSIYRCTKKYIRYIRRGAIFSVIFFLLFSRGVFAWGLIFSKIELADVGKALQCYEMFNWLCCVLCCCHNNTLWLVRHPAQDKNGTGASSAPFTALYPRQQHTDVCKLYATKWQTLPLFWNCVCKSYIFTCRLLLFCVLEICCIGFFVKIWKSKIQCVLKKCVTLKM